MPMDRGINDRLDLYQIVLDRINHQVGRILTPRLGQNIGAMFVDGSFGNK